MAYIYFHVPSTVKLGLEQDSLLRQENLFPALMFHYPPAHLRTESKVVREFGVVGAVDAPLGLIGTLGDDNLLLGGGQF